MTKSPLSRVLVLDGTPSLRADYAAMLQPAQGQGEDDLQDDGFAGLFGCLAPPPSFPPVDLLLAEEAVAALTAVKEGKAEGRPFAVALIDLRAEALEADLQLLESLRAADPEIYLVAVSADPSMHPLEVAERVPPVEQIFYLLKPFHPFELHNLVLALTARWHGSRKRVALDGATAGARAGASLQGAFSALPCGLIVFDRRDNLVAANDRLRALLPELEDLLVPGMPYEELQKEIARRLLPDDTLFLEDAWVKERLEWHAKSGGVTDLRLTAGRWLILAEAGGALGETFCLYLDASGLKRRDQNRAAGQRLRYVSEALEAFCEALGAAADESGQLPVKDLGRRLFHSVARDGELPDKVDEAKPGGANADEAADNAQLAELGRKLRIITQSTPLLAEPLHLDAMIAELFRDRRPKLPEAVDVEIVAGAGLWAVDADKALIRTAIAALMDNALAAVGQRGCIVIETENLRLDRDFVASRPALTQGDYVRLSVSDDGTGMTGEQAERALIPFCGNISDRAEDPAERQLGLGLSMALGAVSQLGGHLETESKPGEGATLRVFLPRAKGAVAKAKKRARAEPPLAEEGAPAPKRKAQDAPAAPPGDDEGMIW